MMVEEREGAVDDCNEREIIVAGSKLIKYPTICEIEFNDEKLRGGGIFRAVAFMLYRILKSIRNPSAMMRVG